MSPLGVGFIGCGRIMDLNILGYLDRDDVRLAAFCDIDEEILARRVGEYGPARTYLEVDEMLADDEVDVVEVLTPHFLHKEHVLAALAAGKHVSLQKPPAVTMEEMDEMICAAANAGRKLKVYENFVFYPPYVRARELVRSGEIGRPVALRIKMNMSMAPTGWEVPLESWAWRVVREMCGGGPCLFDDGYHKWSVAIDLLGRVEKVFAWIGAREMMPGVSVDAPAVVAWRYEGEKDLFGVCDEMMSEDLHIASKYYAIDERMEVTGEKGVIWVTGWTADMLGAAPVVMYRDGEITEFTDMPRDWAESFSASTHHFIDAIKDGTEPSLTGEQGREVLKMALAIMRSAREERQVYLNEFER